METQNNIYPIWELLITKLRKKKMETSDAIKINNNKNLELGKIKLP